VKLAALLCCLALLLAPAAARAQAVVQPGEEWAAYRDIYRQMIWFEKYGKPKQYLQNHLRARPRDPGAALDGARLTLNGKNTNLALALDAVGRAVFPFSKAAYDDNAELNLNRKAGQFKLQPWVSIAPRADGVYPAAELRAACEQLLAYLRYAGDATAGGKACAGVQFSYARGDTAAQVELHAANGARTPLPAREGPAFPGDAVLTFRIVAVRFAALPEGGQITTSSAPLAIAALLE
jgi:hypothetical protein